MASRRPQVLLSLTVLVFILSMPACGGDGTASPEVQTSPSTMIEVTPTDSQEQAQDPPEPVAQEWGDVVIWEASDAYAANGIQMGAGGDVDTEAVFAGDPEEQARRFGSGEALPSDDGNSIEDYFMRFNIDDEFIYRGSPTSRLMIEIEYLDVGIDSFFVEYDAQSGGPNGDGRFKPTDYVIKTDSGEFRTAVFWLNDAYFGNRIQEADFRIDGAANGAETIGRVTVTRIMPGSDLASALFVDFYHDGNQLTLGQCTTLHWDVQNANRVTLNGSQVDPQGYDYECPQSTTTYVLQAQNANEQVQEEITIAVSPQPPTAHATYDLWAYCHGIVIGSFEFVVFINHLEYPGQTTLPIMFDAYIGPYDDYSYVSSVAVPSLGGSGPVEFRKTIDGPGCCCRIVLRGNNDADPANDSSVWVP